MYTLKRLTETHRLLVQAHFLRLDESSRYTRFCAHMQDANLKHYVSEIDFKTDGIFGIFDDNLDIIGMGECVFYETPDEHGQKQAEVGFSVEKAYQGQQLGNRLMKRVIQFAHANHTKILLMYCLSTNAKTMHLARKYGLKTQTEYGESKAIITMPQIPPFASQYNEQIEDSLATIELNQKINHQFFENNWKLFTTFFNPDLSKN